MTSRRYGTDEIVEFYEDTAWEYQFFWSDYNLHYGFYDDDHTTHRAAMENSNRTYAEKLGVSESDVVLDIGTGRGGLPIWIAENVGATVYGVDLDPGHVRDSLRNARERDVADGANFIIGTFLDLPFPDDSFDAVSGIETVCHAKDKCAVLAELRRVLKPGGRLLVADGYQNGDLTDDEAARLETTIEGWAVPELARVEAFRTYLEDLGFVDVEFSDHREQILPSARRQYLLSLAITPLLKVAALLGIKSDLSVRQGYTLYHQYAVLKNRIGIHGEFTARLPENA